MTTVNIRKQGGAAVMTIPADVLKKLAVGLGEALELDVTDGVMVARPARTRSRRRYSVSELLEGVTPAVARAMTRESVARHVGPSVGRELP
jgi:antitoxin ChpS